MSSGKVGRPPLYYTAEEVAPLYGLAKPTVYEWASQGKIPCIRRGRKVLFWRTEIDRLTAEKHAR